MIRTEKQDTEAFMNKDAEEAMQRNMAILRGRLITILDRALQKIQLVCCLRVLLENGAEPLQHIFSREERRIIIRDLWQYIPQSSRSGMFFKSHLSSIKEISEPESMADPKVTSVIVKCFSSDKIMKFVECYWEKCDGPARDFLELFMELREVMVEKFHTPFDEERKYEKMLGKLYKMNKYHITKIKAREELYNKIEMDKISGIKERQAMINSYNQKLSEMKSSSLREKLKIINVAERTMAGNTMVSTEKTENLAEESVLYEKQYNSLLEEHLKEEKILRSKRYKLETQLANWLHKYDTEVGDLHKELEVQIEGYTSEKVLMDELEEKFNLQTEEYVPLMEERRLEELRLFDLKLAEFMVRRSCKIIQRWWKKIYERRMRRRLGKGGKKGKKGKTGKK